MRRWVVGMARDPRKVLWGELRDDPTIESRTKSEAVFPGADQAIDQIAEFIMKLWLRHIIIRGLRGEQRHVESARQFRFRQRHAMTFTEFGRQRAVETKSHVEVDGMPWGWCESNRRHRMTVGIEAGHLDHQPEIEKLPHDFLELYLEGCGFGVVVADPLRKDRNHFRGVQEDAQFDRAADESHRPQNFKCNSAVHGVAKDSRVQIGGEEGTSNRITARSTRNLQFCGASGLDSMLTLIKTGGDEIEIA